MGTAHSISTRVGHQHWDLCMGNRNVTLLNEKQQELVWEAEQYHLDIVEVSSTKCRGSDTVESNEIWKLFYSCVDVTMSAQDRVGIFVSPRLAHCVADWISLALVEIALQKVASVESIVLLGDFNAHVGTDNKTWKSVIRRQGDSNINRNKRCLLQFCAINRLCIINIFFRHKKIHKYTWCRDSVGQRSIIDFCIVSADLFSSVVDVRVKRGAELSTDHHLVVCILRGPNHPRTRKRFKARRAYRIKWKLLSDKKMGHIFASKVASLFRELADYTEDVETEWDLFKSAVITSADAICDCKRVGGQMGSEKRTAWWNQQVKKPIR